MADVTVTDLAQQMRTMKGPWSTAEIVTVNGNKLRVRVMENYTARWHAHETSEEVFLVLSGTLNVDTESGTSTAGAGGLIVVPRGVSHRARVEGRTELLVIDAL